MVYVRMAAEVDFAEGGAGGIWADGEGGGWNSGGIAGGARVGREVEVKLEKCYCMQLTCLVGSAW